MQDTINDKINTLLNNSLVETPNGVMQMVHLSDLVETIGDITASIDTVSASQLEKLQANTTIAVLLRLFESSYLTYIDPNTNEEVSVNVLMFSKIITPKIMTHIYVFDRDALESRIDANDISTTASSILQGKLQSIQTPVIVMFNSGDTPDTENIDGNLTTMSYIDKFYNFGTKYGFALIGQTETEYQMFTIYDLPNTLSYSNKVSILLNFVQDEILFSSIETATEIYRNNLARGITYPIDMAKYIYENFKAVVAFTMSNSEPVIEDNLQELKTQLRDATATKQSVPVSPKQPTTKKKDIEQASKVIAKSIKEQLKGSGIYIENITIDTVNIYTSSE